LVDVQSKLKYCGSTAESNLDIATGVQPAKTGEPPALSDPVLVVGSMDCASVGQQKLPAVASNDVRVLAAKNTAVFGLYRDEAQLNDGVDALKAAGYRNTDISVLFPDNRGTKDFAHEKNTKAPEGTAAGATSGMAIGGTLGWLSGVGALAIPGIGPFIAAGPIVAAWLAPAPAALWADLSERWWEWASPSMKPSGTNVEFGAAEF
jgi:hypothetical protein